MLRVTLCVTLIFLTTINNTMALNKDKLEQLTELMILGCSLGKDVGLKVNVEGNLMLFKKGAKGNFEAKRSEMPNIINFLTTDSAKNKQAKDIRNCTMHYMDKIFDEVIGDRNKNKESFVKNSNGVIMKLLSCNKKNRNNIICTFDLTSAFRDRTITIKSKTYEYSSQLFDDASNRYYPDTIQIANHISRKDRNLDNVPIIADIKADLKLVFKNISTQAKSISLLKVGTLIRVDDKAINEFFDFRDIIIE